MKLLAVTNLFPNAQEPERSTFNFQQFLELAKSCELKVVAPIPHFQYSNEQVPSFEQIGGIDVSHPRYLVIPKIGRCSHGLAFFIGIWHTLKTIQRSFQYDAILAAWAYPDAFGSALAARLLKKKFFVKVHGSDINLADQYWSRVPMIRWALNQADSVIAVSLPLKQKIVGMGIPQEKVFVISNGVDTKKFFARPKDVCREKLGLSPSCRFILFVGNFSPVKGVLYLIKAFALLVNMPDLKLVLVGDGEERAVLMQLGRALGVGERVIFAGRKPHQDIPVWMSAADVFCLPSLNEGCPNVLLEAMACGTNVVACNVGGVPDIIDAVDKGWLARPKDPEDLARCLIAALKAPGLAQPTRAISWAENAKILFDLLMSRH